MERDEIKIPPGLMGWYKKITYTKHQERVQQKVQRRFTRRAPEQKGENLSVNVFIYCKYFSFASSG